MRVRIVIGRKLSLDIRQRNISTDADVHALCSMGNIEVDISHHRVVAVLVIAREKLLRKDTLGRRVTIVLSPDLSEAEAPVEVFSLDRVRKALDVENLLVRNNAIGIVVIRSRGIRVVSLIRRADIEPSIEPAIDLDPAAVLVDYLHQHVRLGIRRPDNVRSSDTVVSARKRRRIERRRIPTPHWIWSRSLRRVPILSICIGKTNEEWLRQADRGA